MGVKFRNIKTGRVYETWDATFCKGVACSDCPLTEYNRAEGDDCWTYLCENPEESEKVGYEPIYDEAPECITVGDTAATRKEILEKAIRCVCGDRDQQYGTPEDSFKAIASMWNSYLYAKGLIINVSSEWKGIKPDDVAAMMVLFKMARVATGSYSADSWVDAAGYAACGGEIGGLHDSK